MLSNVDLAKENEALKKRVLELEAETANAMVAVKDSADVVELMKDEKIQLERQAKEPLIKALCRDSKGCFNEDGLNKLSLDALLTLRANFESEISALYQDWLENRRMRDEARARTRCGTVGTYNQNTGKWENGSFGTDEGVV